MKRIFFTLLFLLSAAVCSAATVTFDGTNPREFVKAGICPPGPSTGLIPLTVKLTFRITWIGASAGSDTVYNLVPGSPLTWQGSNMVAGGNYTMDYWWVNGPLNGTGASCHKQLTFQVAQEAPLALPLVVK